MTERELLKVFSSNIKRYRIFFNLSQAALAEKVNISINFLSDIETGKKWASPTTMVKMAEIFNVEAYELLKPEKVLPDKTSSIMLEYTNDISRAITRITADYLERMA